MDQPSTTQPTTTQPATTQPTTTSETIETEQPVSTDPTYVRYHPDIETLDPKEEELIDRIVTTLHSNNERAYKTYRHGLRDAHAKGHGILEGSITVYPDLQPELAQGMFAQPGKYPVIARLSSTSGAIRHDRLRGVRGLGVKVLGVEGERAMVGDEATTQDFILVTHREFLFADVREYATRGMIVAWLLARIPDRLLGAGSELAATVDRLLVRFGRPLPPTLQVFIRPNTHILGDTFFSSAPFRWGDYVAKFLIAPLSDNVRALENVPLGQNPSENANREMIAEFFANNGADYELRVQLCTDLDAMPIENATLPWPEEASPHIPVAKIHFPKQDPASPTRRAFGDDVLSFNSWRGLEAHRPLGSINRMKLRVYEASSDFRHEKNGIDRLEPADISELPD